MSHDFFFILIAVFGFPRVNDLENNNSIEETSRSYEKLNQFPFKNIK